MEGTHITDPDKLSTLLAVLALAVALAVKTGVTAARLKSIPIKKHGRKACSLFALGIHSLRKIFAARSPNISLISASGVLSGCARRRRPHLQVGNGLNVEDDQHRHGAIQCERGWSWHPAKGAGA